MHVCMIPPGGQRNTKHYRDRLSQQFTLVSTFGNCSIELFKNSILNMFLFRLASSILLLAHSIKIMALDDSCSLFTGQQNKICIRRSRRYSSPFK
mmetsp:Transcript_26308/g.54248  ORF Transcript_26308/g.54248 Transcript_26308/m.54248 type:complete len:95 (-) Transcript_26308:706-990(-)